MKQTVIEVSCDICLEEAPAGEGGDWNVRIQTARVEWELDACPGCLHDYLAHARPRAASGAHTCGKCLQVYRTARGLQTHQTRSGH